MKKKIILEIGIPEGVECKIDHDFLKCKKNEVELSKRVFVPGMKVEIDKDKIKLICEKGNKKDRAIIGSNASHIRNLLKGLEEKYVYELEICHVHFPMAVKIDGKELIIDNFLGEKFKRRAKILEGVEINIDGKKIVVSGNDLEATGQTAANIEKSTKVYNKDRRIFQDGIFITSKKGVAI